MPPRKYVPKKTKRFTKRKYPKRARAKRTTLVNKGVSPMAARYITALKYTTLYSFSNAIPNICKSTVFNLNSLYDTDRTNLGHQPYGYDTLSSIYSRYRVFAASWKITVLPDPGVSGQIAFISTNQSSGYNGLAPDAMMEQPRAFHKPLSLNMPTIVRGKCNLAKLNGVTSAVYKSDDRYQASVSANPLEELTLHIMTWANAPVTYQITIELTFHAEFFDAISLGQS